MCVLVCVIYVWARDNPRGPPAGWIRDDATGADIFSRFFSLSFVALVPKSAATAMTTITLLLLQYTRVPMVDMSQCNTVARRRRLSPARVVRQELFVPIRNLFPFFLCGSSDTLDHSARSSSRGRDKDLKLKTIGRHNTCFTHV